MVKSKSRDSMGKNSKPIEIIVIVFYLLFLSSIFVSIQAIKKCRNSDIKSELKMTVKPIKKMEKKTMSKDLVDLKDYRVFTIKIVETGNLTRTHLAQVIAKKEDTDEKTIDGILEIYSKECEKEPSNREEVTPIKAVKYTTGTDWKAEVKLIDEDDVNSENLKLSQKAMMKSKTKARELERKDRIRKLEEKAQAEKNKKAKK